MNGHEVYEILREKWVYNLHHANTLITACTFLRLGGLASRGYVVDHRLPQTPQYTDNADRKFGIWYDIFLDGIDLHERGKIRNNYGPVLFIIPTTILLNLPNETEVFVTRKNPSNWVDGEMDEDRYFITPEELRDGYTYGDFGQHIILRTSTGILPFNVAQLNIILDDPQCQLLNGNDAYANAIQMLQSSASVSGLNLNIAKRQCRQGCRCMTGHRYSYDQIDVNTCF